MVTEFQRQHHQESGSPIGGGSIKQTHNSNSFMNAEHLGSNGELSATH